MAKRTALAIVTCFLTAVSALVQSPGFTGAWVLDPEKSVLHQAGTREIRLTIVETGSTVDVTQHIRRREDHYKCSTSGAPCKNITAARDSYTRRLRKENGSLVWQITMTRAVDNATIAFNERWSLSDGGRTLTVHRVYPTGQEILQVFARKQP
jgi:hypothetical protein